MNAEVDEDASAMGVHTLFYQSPTGNFPNLSRRGSPANMSYRLVCTLFLFSWMAFADGDKPEQKTAFESLQQACSTYLAEASAGLEMPFEAGLAAIYEIDLDGFKHRWSAVPAARTSSPLPDPVFKKVKHQAQEVTIFLRNLFQSNGFRELGLRPFRSVKIVPRNILGPWRQMEIIGDILVLRMGWRVLRSDELLSMWNKGHQFPWRSFERKMWKYLNPNGLSMRLTRDALKSSGAVLGRGLMRVAQMPQTGSTPSTDPLHEKALLFLRGSLGTEQGTVLDFEAKLREISEDQLRDWLVKLSTTVGDPLHAESIVASAQAAPEQGNLDINIVDSWMIYGNFHWITVLAGYGGQTTQRILSQSTGSANGSLATPAVRNGQVNVIRSIVGGYTVDVVDVRAFSDRLLLASAIATTPLPPSEK
jgi:hypothetical protein